MYLGDNLIADGIASLVEEYRRIGCNSQILLAKVPNPEQFGVAELSDGTVIRLTEKPKEPRSNLALVGVYMFDDTIWDAVKSIRPSARNALEITDVIQWLIDHGRSVHPHVVSGWWKDTGKVEDMLEANRIILDTFLASGAEGLDEGSRVEGKVVIEPGAPSAAPRSSGPGPRSGPPSWDRTRRSVRAAASRGAKSRTRSSSKARRSNGSRAGLRTR